MINAETMSKMLHEYRATLRRPPARGGSMKFSRSSSFTSAMTVNSHSSSFESKSTTMIAGQAKIEIVNAENLKPCNKNGLANPYVVVKVPEGTQVLSSMDDESIPVIHHQNQATSSSAAAVVSSPILSSASSTVSSNNNNTSTAFNSTTNNGRPSSIKSSVSDKSNGNNNNNNTSSSSSSAATPSTTVLSGKDCELARSRIEYDSLNVSWDESFHCILPAVDKLDILIYSKNMISADEQMGRAEIDFAQLSALSSSSSATTSVVSRSNSDAGVGGLAKTMRAVNLHDHQTHDIWIDVEPQGRLLLRLTLEGEDEDVDFWFKKSIERLGRTRDDFYRVLTAKVQK